jgi:DNA topoisomerase-2
MTDQDLDGSHIKGLGINMFQSEWSSLVEIPGFIGFMNTPILKAKKGNQELKFYNDGEYELWKKENDEGKGWNIKYYKGLGTSTGKEFREYFEHKKIVDFEFSGNNCMDSIDMVFNKKRADDRKEWLGNYNRELYLDTNETSVSYNSFINQELIHFSKYDCDRSIPNLMDGLKISLRKILYSAFKKNLTSEIKVAQFSGYVSEHSGYHHGEASLNGAIVGMAQNFVGSNNINLLVPNGQFGTRLQGGKDSASERYIFTLLNKITRTIYPPSDDKILTYLNDDGLIVEPIFYAPIIPMILVNGSKGIGTGFSTEVLCYNPVDIMNYLFKLLDNQTITEKYQFIPYYNNFKGSIKKLNNYKFIIKGIYEKIGTDKIRVTELPVGFWTEDFKELIEKLIDPAVNKDGKKTAVMIKDYDDLSKDTTVDFTITFSKGKLDDLEKETDENGCNGIHKLLKLSTTFTTSNMHLFNAQDKLQKYDCVEDIIEEYYQVRLNLYQKRKTYLIEELNKELLVLRNKVNYIKEILNDTIDLRKKKKDEVVQLLIGKKYDMIDGDQDFKYLVKMSMDSVTEENVERLNNDYKKKQDELEKITNTSIQDMWLQELNKLKLEYEELIKLFEEKGDKLKTKDPLKSVAKKKLKISKN